jgi:hypothetical protein
MLLINKNNDNKEVDLVSIFILQHIFKVAYKNGQNSENLKHRCLEKDFS